MSPAKPKKTVLNKSGAAAETATKPSPAKARAAARAAELEALRFEIESAWERRATLTPEEIVSMDWFCDNVEGSIPPFDRLRPEYTETVRVLGLCREALLPEAEGGQL